MGQTSRGLAIRGIVPDPVYPTNPDILDDAANFIVQGTPTSPHTRGSYGHGKATRLYWSEAAGCWVRLRVKNARKGSNTVAHTK